MPRRKIPLYSGDFYHIFNRSIGKEIIFSDKGDPARALDVIYYYQFETPPVPFSQLLKLNPVEQSKIFENLLKIKEKIVEIICFCLMPNHYHLILKQLKDGGASVFMKNFQSSYGRFYNLKNERLGPLFESRFKSVKIESQEQLLHDTRYVHLNPLTSGVVKTESELLTYPWSSLPEYLDAKTGFCAKEAVMVNFSGPKSYREFVLSQKDYQKQLKEIKEIVAETTK